MQASQQALFDRLMAFEIDSPGAQLTFAHRLARENGWTLAYSNRAIAEYKKFLFLGMMAGHVASPSEQVDQVWHLHLTYTRSYWDDLCKSVLGRPLHHHPTAGGDAEQTKFIDLYNQTLDSYRRLIGEEPPPDIWSPAQQRFGDDLQHVSVNTARCWIVPKPRLPGWTGIQNSRRRVPLLAAVALGTPLLFAGLNPWEWKGPDFLVAYLVVSAVALILACLARLLFDAAQTRGNAKAQPALDPYEAACLAAGPVRAVQAAFASMVHAGTLQLTAKTTRVFRFFSSRNRTIRQGDALPPNAPRMEHVLYEQAATTPASLAPLLKAGIPIATEIRDSLISRGLMQSPWPNAARLVAGTVMAAPLVLGVPKIFIGLTREKPVTYLVILCIATFIAALLFLFAISRLTPLGASTLKSLQNSYATTAALDGTAAARLGPVHLATAIGLFGVGVLATGPLSEVHAMLPRAAGGGGCSAGGGGCGAGCGGGGCGGGGCGGCGGCGGGD